MKSNVIWKKRILAFAAGTLCLAFLTRTSAQVRTQTTTTSGIATQEVTIESGVVAAVAGNDLFVNMADGTLRHFPNIPESARATVD